MSACYTIELNMKFKSPESMSDAVRSLQEYIKKDAETDYDLEFYAADGIGTENIDDLMKIFFLTGKGNVLPLLIAENGKIILLISTLPMVGNLYWLRCSKFWEYI